MKKKLEELEDHDLYISNGEAGYSVIYKSSPLNATSSDRTISERLARETADKTGESVWTWLSDVAAFADAPEYIPKDRRS